ncbi:MAG: hypothetical protein IJV27_08610 [Prevotella sp.]|nr:hypothetical protein [Prevotella sp.]
MSIQDSKEKFQALYEDLKKEADGTFTPTGVYMPPSRYSYYKKAKALVDEAIKYAEQGDGIILEHVLHTFDKEVSYVYNYDGKRKSNKKQQKELETLMRKATHQLYIDLCPLVKE